MNVTMLSLANMFARQQSELGPLSDSNNTSLLPFRKQGLLTIFANVVGNAFPHSKGFGFHLVHIKFGHYECPDCSLESKQQTLNSIYLFAILEG